MYIIKKGENKNVKSKNINYSDDHIGYRTYGWYFKQ